ncbi:hypothetical protein BN000_00087 [Mycobacterium europaeum]|uniref:Uncharacterized protein n=1 Tax=Mycobacterium europaeum TaxID=761804 RepID=A0A0U1CU32_9MYCO|nr:hypothetical protein BN000_00087 [Mycobacterium europaeum]
MAGGWTGVKHASTVPHSPEYTLRAKKFTDINNGMVSRAPHPSLASHPVGRAIGTCTQLPTTDSDIALVRGYSRELKIACDELHDDPFNPNARAQLMRLILHDSKNADAAQQRLQRHQVLLGRH